MDKYEHIEKSIICTNKSCYICGGKLEHVHHVMYGTANRKLAEQYGLTIGLCERCHREVHNQPGEYVWLKEMAQKKFEAKYGHELWIRTFKRNYL